MAERSTEIERLVTVFDANYQKLDEKLTKVIRSNYAAAAKVEKAWDKKLGAGAAKGLEDLAKQAGRASGPVQGFTQQLGLAGASSLALAAALGAATFAAQRAIEAMEFGDDLQAQADKIGVTAERLQELQFVADETDIPVDKLAASLEKLNGVVGAIKTGVGDTRIKEAVAALGLTPADLANVRTGVDLLPILADRLGRVGTVAEQVQIAKKMGVEDLLPALRLGSDGIAELEARSRSLGLVLSNSTVRQLADANREMEIAGQQIRTSLRAGFSGLASDIAGVTTNLAQFLVFLRNVEERAPIAGAIMRSAMAAPFGGAASSWALRGGGSGDRVADVDGQGIDAFLRLNSKPQGSFVPQFDKPKGGSKDSSAADAKARQDRTRRVAEEIYRAQLAELDIHNNTNRSLEDQLGFGLDRLDLEREHRRVQLDQLEEEYRTSKAKSGITAAERQKLEQAEEMVRAGEERNLRDRVADGLREEQQRHLEALAEADLDLLSFAADAAVTAQGRVALERELLIETRRLGRQRLEEELRLNNNLSEADKASRLAAFDRVSNGAVRGFDANVTNRLREQFRDAFSGAIYAVAEGDALSFFKERLKARAIEGLADAIFNALNGVGGGGGGLLGSVLNIFGFRAGGGSVLRGRPYVVGERGPEVVVPGANGQVISNDVLRSIGAQRAAPVVVTQQLHFHAEGAVLTQELLEQFGQVSRRDATSSYLMAASTIPATMQRRARRRL